MQPHSARSTPLPLKMQSSCKATKYIFLDGTGKLDVFYGVSVKVYILEWS